MVINSKYFPPERTHKGNCAAPDGASFNQTEFILIDKRFTTTALDRRSL